jgi:hypothetical protein
MSSAGLCGISSLFDGVVEREAQDLVEVEDGLGGQRPAFVSSAGGESPVEGGELIGSELAELHSSEVGDQVVLD